MYENMKVNVHTSDKYMGMKKNFVKSDINHPKNYETSDEKILTYGSKDQMEK